MPLSRRDAIKLSGTLALAAAVGASPGGLAEQLVAPGADQDWNGVGQLFALSEDRIHMSAMLISSHPAPVREAIERYRQALDADPVQYLEENNAPLTEATRDAAARYLGVHPSHIALTDSTTMGVGLVYNGLVLQPGQELLTTDEDYFVTHESLRTAAARSGASVRRIALFHEAATATADEIVSRIAAEITPATRLVALTWVHSSTGIKLPIATIAAALQEINAGRAEGEEVLLGIDGVHGFGIEAVDFPALGCDFLMSGCHKWLFGPRGTGIVAMSSRGLGALLPSIPSFTDDAVFGAWLEQRDLPPGGNDGPRMTPGGFKAFEHVWALTEAFALHAQLGPGRIMERTHGLASLLKQSLAGIEGVTLRTPMAAELSAGIVSFDVAGHSANSVVARLREQGVVASAAPYAEPHVRLTPSIRNSEAEIESAAAAVRAII